MKLMRAFIVVVGFILPSSTRINHNCVVFLCLSFVYRMSFLNFVFHFSLSFALGYTKPNLLDLFPTALMKNKYSEMDNLAMYTNT